MVLTVLLSKEPNSAGNWAILVTDCLNEGRNMVVRSQLLGISGNTAGRSGNTTVLVHLLICSPIRSHLRSPRLPRLVVHQGPGEVYAEERLWV